VITEQTESPSLETASSNGQPVSQTDPASLVDSATQRDSRGNSEPTWKRRLFLLIALAITAGYWFFIHSFLAPAPGRPGIDENAYLVAGKNIAQHLTTGFKTTDDYQFVGAMWLRTKSGWYYPKYPFGLPLLNAITVLLGHREWAFAISPLCASIAVLGMFFLAREIVGSFYALLAMLVLAMGPVMLQLADIPSSHASALCFVVWGMFFLWRWCQSGRWQLALLAGLLLGFAVTIRYTEALLLFPFYSLHVLRADQYTGPGAIIIFKALGVLPLGPMGIAAISRVRWKNWRSYLRAALPVIAWAVPVGALLLFNRFSMGQLTGYDDTNESHGFSIGYFVNKWDFSLYQNYVFGLFFVLPLGIAGLILMYRSAERFALLLTLWLVPGAFLYTAYYWGQNLPSIAYLRFFLTLFPPVIIAAMWLLRSAASGTKGSIVSPLAAGILTAMAASIGLSRSLDELERQHRGNLNLHYSAQRIMAHVKAPAGHKPMILADTGMLPQLLQYMQFMVDADWYASDVFSPKVGGGFGLAGFFQKNNKDTDSPVLIQRERIEYIDNVRKGKTYADFVRDEQNLMDQALSAGRTVYVVLPPGEVDDFRKRVMNGKLEMRELERWTEPCAIRFPDESERNWLALPVWGNSMTIPWSAQTWAMQEIRRPAATGATSTPSR
jgi:4-amino-4-deoxy-L-arabinose transferase-like glycosyltransferase